MRVIICLHDRSQGRHRVLHLQVHWASVFCCVQCNLACRLSAGIYLLCLWFISPADKHRDKRSIRQASWLVLFFLKAADKMVKGSRVWSTIHFVYHCPSLCDLIDGHLVVLLQCSSSLLPVFTLLAEDQVLKSSHELTVSIFPISSRPSAWPSTAHPVTIITIIITSAGQQKTSM